MADASDRTDAEGVAGDASTPGDGAAASALLERVWRDAQPGRLMGRGHPVGDFLEAWDWRVLEERPGFLRLAVHLPPQVRNPRGLLFGGFTPTYVDLVAVYTYRAGAPRTTPRRWLATLNMRVDYLEPVVSDFEIESEVVSRRGRTGLIQTRFRAPDGRLLVFALTTAREVD